MESCGSTCRPNFTVEVNSSPWMLVATAEIQAGHPLSGTQSHKMWRDVAARVFFPFLSFWRISFVDIAGEFVRPSQQHDLSQEYYCNVSP